ncbi:MAG: hypothetical protein JO307_02400 [Bryobacterales bacterium]|nr:hypothetical protein [Bryobacterales bacterium]
MAEDADGVLPREWDPELVAQSLSAGPSEAHYFYSQMLAYYRSVDLGDGRAASQHLENALAESNCGATNKLRAWCFFNAASQCAREGKNPANAKVWLDRAKKLDRTRPIVFAEADIAMGERLYEDALRSWAAARSFIEGLALHSGQHDWHCGRSLKARPNA